MKKSIKGLNWIILVAVIILAIVPLLMKTGSEFGGADGLAEEAIQEITPNYEPWFQPLIELPGGETESLLFAVQAALGAGFVGYAIGFFKGRSITRKEKE
jgi:cobalt/nickel transport protein